MLNQDALSFGFEQFLKNIKVKFEIFRMEFKKFFCILDLEDYWRIDQHDILISDTIE